MAKLSELFNNIQPTKLAQLRGRRNDTSTRDKNTFLKKIKEVEDILEKLEIEIEIKSKKQ